MYTIKTLKNTVINGVKLDAGHQYTIQTITDDMLERSDLGEIDIIPQTTTVEERQADTAAFKWE